MAHDVVLDAEDARDLVEGRGLGGEVEQVVRALDLVVDLVGEPAAAPRVMQVPRAVTLLDQLADTADDLALTALFEAGVEQQQNLVLRHGFPRSPSFGLVGLAGQRTLWAAPGTGDACARQEAAGV